MPELPENYGAVGDGVADDTLAVQSAINSGEAVFRKRAVYKVSPVGVKRLHGYNASYCLTLPAYSSVDMNGATLRLANGSNASIVVPGGDDDTVTEGFSLRNGVIDGNRSNQTYTAYSVMPCLYLANCVDARVSGLKIVEARDYAARIVSCIGSRFIGLEAAGSDGQGFEFGAAYLDHHLSDCRIDGIYAERCTGLRSSTQPGNSATFVVKNCDIGEVIARNCAAGIKIQATSKTSTFRRLFMDGLPVASEPAYGTANSGTKIQFSDLGGGVIARPRGISIGEVVSTNCAGTGLYIEKADECYIGRYYGDANNGANQGDVWISGVGNYLHSLAIRAGGDAAKTIYIRPDSDKIRISHARVTDCRGAASVQVHSDGLVSIGELHVNSGNGMVYALRVTNTSSKGRLETLASSLPTNIVAGSTFSVSATLQSN